MINIYFLSNKLSNIFVPIEKFQNHENRIRITN